jgi:hypothetical protein
MMRRLTAEENGAAGDDDIIAAQLNECLDKATAEDPDARYATAEAFAKALTEAAKRPPSRLRRILGVTLILLLAVLVIMQWPSQYRFDNTLFRVNPDESRTELVDGATVLDGDRLVLEVTTTVPMYVYVFAEDDYGNAWGLFPQAGAGHSNLLRADESHTLPGDGDDASTWVISDATGLAKIHILAFPEEVAAVRLLYQALPGLGEANRPVVAATPLVEASRILDEDDDLSIGVTYRVIEVETTED